MNIFRKIRRNFSWGILGLLLFALPACQSGSQAPDSEIRIVPHSNRGPAIPNLPGPVEEDSQLRAPQEPPRSVTEAPPLPRLAAPPAESLPESLPSDEEVSEASVSPSDAPVALVAEPPRWKYKKYFFVIFDGM